MSARATLDHFFRNLARLIGDSRMTPQQISRAIGREPGYITELTRRKVAPDLEAACEIAEVLRVNLSDLLRSAPCFIESEIDSHDCWAERLAGQILADAIEESRPPPSKTPSIDAILHWWHQHGGHLVDMEAFAQYVEIFAPPDSEIMRPVPQQMGPQSLGARELGLVNIDQFNGIFWNAKPHVARAIAEGHAAVIGGSPSLSFRSLMVDMSSGRVIRMTYARLLLPVQDGDGRQFALNYAKPMRRGTIGAEDDGKVRAAPNRQPILTRID